MDMRMLIKTLLQVQASSRPNCDQILELPIVVKRIRKYFPEKMHLFLPAYALENDENAQSMPQMPINDSELLRTIKL